MLSLLAYWVGMEREVRARAARVLLPDLLVRVFFQ
jgi:hypothetical protein